MSDSLPLSDSQIQTMVVAGFSDVFRTMLQSVISLESCLRVDEHTDAASPLSQIDDTLVVGNVGFVGSISGMVYIAMPEPLAKIIAKTMLGMDDSELDGEKEMINDVIGEITNMSAGAYKNQMADMGYPCRLTIPSIIRGKYFVVEAARAAFRQIYLFKFKGMPLTFELIMKPIENGQD